MFKDSGGVGLYHWLFPTQPHGKKKSKPRNKKTKARAASRRARDSRRRNRA